jgi:hypothetical protein
MLYTEKLFYHQRVPKCLGAGCLVRGSRLVRDSSAVRLGFFLDLLEPWDVRELYIRKTRNLIHSRMNLVPKLEEEEGSVTPLSEGKIVMNE